MPRPLIGESGSTSGGGEGRGAGQGELGLGRPGISLFYLKRWSKLNPRISNNIPANVTSAESLIVHIL